jgi:nucleotide-binding universal stress UspA family protein
VLRILVATDGSADADAVVGWAFALAARTGAELVVATAAAPGQGGMAGPAGGADPVAGVRVRHLRLAGDPRRVLSGACVVEAPDLVVVGAGSRQWFPAVHLDQVAHFLVCHSTFPIAVVPPRSAATPVSRLILGVDGSAGSSAAIQWVAQAVAELTVDVEAVYATTTPGAVAGITRDAAAGGAQQLRGWIQPLLVRGVGVVASVVHEDPVVALRQRAAELPGSVIVLGGRPADEHRPLRIGSLGLRVLDLTASPVIFIPPDLKTARGGGPVTAEWGPSALPNHGVTAAN